MAWTTMHYGVGMACAGAAATGLALITRRGGRWIPAVMTLGGVWALIPDMPRTFREDFPNLPLASILGAKGLERWLHSIGDLFFFHRRLDLQPHEYALHGLIIILVLYNASLVMLMWRERRALDSPEARAWRAHGAHLPKRSSASSSRRHTRHRRSRHSSRTPNTGERHMVTGSADRAGIKADPAGTAGLYSMLPGRAPSPTAAHHHDATSPVIGRITPQSPGEADKTA